MGLIERLGFGGGAAKADPTAADRLAVLPKRAEVAGRIDTLVKGQFSSTKFFTTLGGKDRVGAGDVTVHLRQLLRDVDGNFAVYRDDGKSSSWSNDKKTRGDSLIAQVSAADLKRDPVGALEKFEAQLKSYVQAADVGWRPD